MNWWALLKSAMPKLFARFSKNIYDLFKVCVSVCQCVSHDHQRDFDQLLSFFLSLVNERNAHSIILCIISKLNSVSLLILLKKSQESKWKKKRSISGMSSAIIHLHNRFKTPRRLLQTVIFSLQRHTDPLNNIKET